MLVLSISSDRICTFLVTGREGTSRRLFISTWRSSIQQEDFIFRFIPFIKKSLNITSGQTCPMHVSAVILLGHHPQTSSALEEMTRRPLRLEKNQTQIPDSAQHNSTTPSFITDSSFASVG